MKTLVKLQNIGDDVINRYYPEVMAGKYNEFVEITSHSLYSDINEYLKGSDISYDLDYNEEDIAALVLSKCNSNYNNHQSMIFGLYTGNLLHILTERNRDIGKKTRIYINGNGSRFDYLFYKAREVDELVVENLRGHAICAGIGYMGNVDRVFVSNIQGDNSLMFAGFKGEINLAVGKNLSGRTPFSYLGLRGGHIKLVVATDIEGEVYLPNISTGQRSSDLVIGRNIKIDDTIYEILSSKYGQDLVISRNIEGDILEDAGWFNSGTFRDVNVVSGNAVIKDYKRILELHRVEEMLRLIYSLESSKPEEIFNSLDKIYMIHRSTK